MEVIAWIGRHLVPIFQFLAIVVTFIGGCYGVWKVVHKPIKTFYALWKRLVYEFSDNGGGSMKDKISKLVLLTEKLSNNVNFLMGRQESLLDELPYPFYQNDENGTCTFVNKAWVNKTGLPKELAIGNGWAEIIHPEDLPTVIKKGEDFIKFGGRDYEGSFRVVHWTTKEIFYVHCTASKIVDKSTGKFVGVVGTIRKIK